MQPHEYLVKTAAESRAIQEAFLQDSGELLVTAAKMMGDCIQQGGKVLILGNGGSAADAQHMAAELVGRMLVERRALPAIALTTDTSTLTAVGNDYGYDHIFARQIQALAKPEDIVIAISTSGNSKNVIAAIHEAQALGCRVIGLTGGKGGSMKSLCDLCLCASQGMNSSRIQETHIFAIHNMVDLMERYFLSEANHRSETLAKNAAKKT